MGGSDLRSVFQDQGDYQGLIMQTTQIRELVRDRSGQEPESHRLECLAELQEFLSNHEVAQYLQFCLPRRTYLASAVRVLDLESIKAEMSEGAAPGGFLRPFGYLVIATDLGGNAICI